MNSVSFTGANLEGASFKNMEIHNTRFRRAIQADFTEASLIDTIIGSTHGVDFTRARLLKTRFMGPMAKSLFRDAEVAYSDSSKMQAGGLVFYNVRLVDADFSGAKLRGIDFRYSNLNRATFRKSKLWDNDFGYANLSQADFTATEFENPILGGANLSAAKFFRAGIDCNELQSQTFDGRPLELPAGCTLKQ